jgi:hypothetical protein
MMGEDGIRWLLRDEFTTALAAGSVNGTNAEPGPGVRTIRDVETLITVSSGWLNLPQLTTLDWTREDIVYPQPITRKSGTILLNKFKASTATFAISGFVTSTTPALGSFAGVENVFYIGNTGFYIVPSVGSIAPVLIYDNTVYNFGLVLKQIGCGYFIKGGIYTNWTLLYLNNLKNTATLYAAFANHGTGSCNATSFRIPTTLWLPTPLLSDGFGSIFGVADGAGHAETTGLGSGGSGLFWTQQLGTWANAAGVASCTVLDVGAGIGIATVTLLTADVLYSCVLGYVAGSGGVIVRYADATNYSYVVNDGTNVKLFEVTTASAYPGTQRGTAVKAPAAGARLIVDVSAAACRVYYNEAFLYAYATLADTTAVKVGMITDNTGNTFNDAVAYAKGTGGEYSILDKYSA